MEADPTFYFYCNNDGRDGGRKEFLDNCFARTLYPHFQ